MEEEEEKEEEREDREGSAREKGGRRGPDRP